MHSSHSIFFEPLPPFPQQNQCTHRVPALKNAAPSLTQKETPKLKNEALFQEMIPRIKKPINRKLPLILVFHS